MTLDAPVHWSTGEVVGALACGAVFATLGAAIALNLGGIADGWYWSTVRWAARRRAWMRKQYRALSVAGYRAVGAAWMFVGLAIAASALAQIGSEPVHAIGAALAYVGIVAFLGCAALLAFFTVRASLRGEALDDIRQAASMHHRARLNERDI